MDARHPASWHRPAFPGDGNSLTKIEYAAIQIFATAMANKMKTFSNPDELTLKGEIASEVFNVAYSSWYFAKRLQEVGYDMLSDGDI